MLEPMLITAVSDLRTCKDCGEAKTHDDFYRSGAYWQPRCKECHNAKSRRRYAADAERIRAKQREYRLNNRDVVRKRQAHNTRKWRYGLSEQRYLELLEEQGHACPGCGTGFTDGVQVDVDHDHACCPGESSCGSCVRGLLCHTCNIALGMVRDDASRLRRLADYLES